MNTSAMNASMRRQEKIEQILIATVAAGGLLLSAGVLSCILYLLFTLASLLVAPRANAQTAPVSARVRLEVSISRYRPARLNYPSYDADAINT